MDKEYLLKKWLNNDLTDAEMQAFNALDDAALYKEIIAESQRFKGVSNAKVPPFSTLDTKLIVKSKAPIHWLKVVSSIAAILLIGFTLFKLTDNNQSVYYKTIAAQNKTITLPDTSIVNLNEHSSLEYDGATWDKNRSLHLKGEAFFDVAKGKVFDVTTAYGNVSVLGTQFNVLSRDSIFKVSCYEGLVKVTYNNEELELPAGTEFVLSSGKTLKTSIVVAEPFWLKKMSVFENTPLTTVIKELEKQYHITVRYPASLQENFTGAFVHYHLENALMSITKPFKLTYVIQAPNEVVISNE